MVDNVILVNSYLSPIHGPVCNFQCMYTEAVAETSALFFGKCD